MSKMKKIIFSIIGSVALIGTGLGFGLSFGLPKKDSDGITTTDTSSYVSIGELWNGKYFSRENLNNLYTAITGMSTATILNIDYGAATPKSAESLRSYTGDYRDIVVRLGGLEWQVVYLSKDSDGNAILTLWLSNNEQDAFAGRSSSEGAYYGYAKSAVTGKTGLYSEWSSGWYKTTTSNGTSAFYPSAMYGTSYIRAVTLNNGGAYATSNTDLISVSKNPYNIFAPFTMPTNGENNDLTDFIVTPAKVSWQKDQSSKTIQGTSYNYPNDAWNTATSDTGFYSAAYNYAEHSNYAQWANDYLWLPSVAETGYNATYTGLWKTSTNQRMNYNGAITTITNVAIGSANETTSPSVYPYSWLRSGYYNYSSDAYYLYPNGIDRNPNNAYYLQAVRPALHLNLDLADECAPETWLEVADTEWEGSGTQTSPYLISTPGELAGLAYGVNKNSLTYEGVYFKQTANIKLDGLGWTPIGGQNTALTSFYGIYDGNGYVIKGLNISNAEKDNQGLFGHTISATIKNITLEDSTIIALGQNIAGIVGSATNSNIINCTNYAYISGTKDDTGGVCGETIGSEGLIKNCVNYGDISSTGAAGGITGYLVDQCVTGCFNYGIIEGMYAGGIAGYTANANAKIEKSINKGKIIASSDAKGIGGIAGYLAILHASHGIVDTLNMDDCASYGQLYISGTDLSIAGALFGVAEAGSKLYMTNCSFDGGSNKDVSPFYGYGSGNYEDISLSGCYSLINFRKNYSIGDFSGYTIMNNMNNGLPMQNNLYSVAIGGNTSVEVINDLKSKGFSLFS